MRVALMSPYALSVYGGVQEQTLSMSRVLETRGHRVLVVAPDSKDGATYDTSAEIVRLGRRWSLPANGSRAPLTLSARASGRARDVIDAFRPDVVHLHEPFAPLLGWSTVRAHRHPTVATFHRSGSGPALRYGAPILRRMATEFDVAVSVSDAAGATARRAYGVASEVLFNGVETDRYVASARQRDGGVVLLYVGRLEPRKGVATLVAAVRRHNERGVAPWRVVIAGDGPARGALEAMGEGDAAVGFIGRIDDQAKREWIRKVHALVAPSTHGESFGLVLLEGMASETLVVASDITGYREAAGGHATLFRPGDAASLESAIEEALRTESASAVAAARQYAERWSMNALVEAYEERYARAVERFRVTR